MKPISAVKSFFFSFTIAAAIINAQAHTKETTDTLNANPLIGGVVVDDRTGKPIGYVHVYVVHGEEESLTNAKGEFKIETSQQFPLTLTADHAGYDKYRVTIKAADRQLDIRLKPVQ